jgi:hypothetical protein
MDEKRQEMIKMNRKNHRKDSLKYRSDRNYDPGVRKSHESIMNSPETKCDSAIPIR